MLRSGWAGIYDDIPDFHPILDRLAFYEGLYCAVGFSGHGFKLSPSVGQWMTQFILTGEKPADLQRLPMTVSRKARRYVHATHRVC